MTATNLDSPLLAQSMDAMQLGVVILDADETIILWNQWIAQHSGISCEQALSRKIDELFPELMSSRLKEAVTYACHQRLPSVLSPALHRFPLPLYRKEHDRHSNHRMQQLIHIMPLAGENSESCVLIQIRDMTATANREKLLRQQAEELKRSNYLDALTGIANRRMFDETLAEEFRRAQRAGTALALALVDIDHFKLYNDHYGHILGDQCLTRVAGGLQSCVKRAGDLAARYGGEEFGIVLPGMDETRASELAVDLCMRISALAIRHETSPVASHVTISVGVAVLKPEIGTHDFNALISSADVALYEAKKEGRNRAILFSIANGSFHACG